MHSALSVSASAEPDPGRVLGSPGSPTRQKSTARSGLRPAEELGHQTEVRRPFDGLQGLSQSTHNSGPDKERKL